MRSRKFCFFALVAVITSTVSLFGAEQREIVNFNRDWLFR